MLTVVGRTTSDRNQDVRLQAGDKSGSGHSPRMVDQWRGLHTGSIPTRQSVLNTLSVIRPDETDRPEHPALASQMHHKQSCIKSSARPMPDPDLNDHTDVNEDINTDLPESTAPMMNSQMDHKRSCFNPSARPMLDSDIVIHTDVNVDIDADLPENSAPMMNSDLIVLELDDAIRLEVLRKRTMENMSSHEFNDQLLSSEYVNLNTAGMFLDQVRSVEYVHGRGGSI